MAASPSASDGAAAAQSRKVAFRFCGECSNLLYPQEDTENNKLMFACRSCRYSEPAHSNCVYRNELSSTVGETAGVTIDVASDPTLPHAQKQCPACGEMEAVFFQSQQRGDETGMALYYTCCTCGKTWKPSSDSG